MLCACFLCVTGVFSEIFRQRENAQSRINKGFERCKDVAKKMLLEVEHKGKK